MIIIITPCSTVLPEKLTGFQPVKNFPAFYETQRFIAAFTSARHLSLSWASWIQSNPLHPHFLKTHLNIILPSTPGSPQWSLSLRFPHQNPVYASLPPHIRYITSASRSTQFYHPNSIWWGVQIIKLLSSNNSRLQCMLARAVPGNACFQQYPSLSLNAAVSKVYTAAYRQPVPISSSAVTESGCCLKSSTR